MASVVEIKSPQNPMLTVDQIGEGLKNMQQMGTRDALARQQMSQALALQPSKLLLSQETAKDLPLLDQAKLMQAQAARKTAGSPFTVTADPITGELSMYDKTTGKWVTPGMETTRGGGGMVSIPTRLSPSTPSTQMSVSPGAGQPAGGLPMPGQFPVNGVLPIPRALPLPLQAPSPNIQGSAPIYHANTATQSRYSPREVTKFDPQTGKTSVFYSPTRTAVSQAEVREMGLGGIHALRDDIVNAIAPYQGGLGRGRTILQRDMADYNATDNPIKKAELADKLTNFYAIANSRNELAATLARATTGAAPGEHTLIQQANQVLNQTPVIPINFPRSLFAQGDQKMFDLTSKLGKSEVAALARATDPSVPASAQVVGALGKVTVPKFNTKADAVKWYNSLTSAQQRRLRG